MLVYITNAINNSWSICGMVRRIIRANDYLADVMMYD